MKLRRLLSAGFSVALALVGCSDTGITPPPPETPPPEVTAGRVPASTLRPTTDPPDQCENQNLDLMETAFGAWLGS